MKVSRKAYYGLRALTALSFTSGGLSVRALAEQEHIPEKYLEKILQTLHQHRLVIARKGIRGGYILAHSPQTVTVWQVLRVLDGGFTNIDRPEITGPIAPCPIVTHCQTKSVWHKLDQTIQATLSNITLADLVPRR